MSCHSNSGVCQWGWHGRDSSRSVGNENKGWFYKLALLDFELIFEVKMQESEGV